MLFSFWVCPLVIDSGLMCYLWVKIYADCHSVMVQKRYNDINSKAKFDM